MTRVSWAEVEPGFHVATRVGDFIGFVDRTPAGQHVAFDGFSTPVGRYDTLQAAKTAIAVEPEPARAERTWRAAAVVTGGVAGVLALTADALVPFV